MTKLQALVLERNLKGVYKSRFLPETVWSLFVIVHQTLTSFFSQNHSKSIHIWELISRLACRKSAGRHVRHNAVNDLIKRALASANVPAILEPNSLFRDDDKRPDGLTVMPWANGRCMVWYFTCPDTLAASHLNRAVVSPGAVANDAEDRKSSKYRSLAACYSFKPVAVETPGALGEEASAIFQDLGRRITAVTAEPRSFQFLIQRLSVT